MRSILKLFVLFGLFLVEPYLPASALRVAAFSSDVTPPPGEPLVWATNLVKVAQPLLAKGVLLEDGTNRFVLCALDWCLLANQSHHAFCRVLAEAAKTDPARIAIQCVHQHAAPYADEQAHRLLESAPKPLPHLSVEFLNAVRARLAAAVAGAQTRLESFNQIGTAAVEVERVASARRLVGPDGRPRVRYSGSGKDPAMAAAPEGRVDPWLRTITFACDNHPLVRLHFYATHPQTFCCDGIASADFVGLAREGFELQEGLSQVYFTGCAGDITVGKYNDGSAGAMLKLAQRLQAAMQSTATLTRFFPATNLVWRVQKLSLPSRQDQEKVLAQSRSWLNDPAKGDSLRVYEGAMRLSYAQRSDIPVVVNSLQIGNVRILHLPGEPMVEFQLYAQQLRANDFVAVAGYGDGGPAYICTDQALMEGGYEPSATNVGQGSEARLKEAIQRLLGH